MKEKKCKDKLKIIVMIIMKRTGGRREKDTEE